MMIVFDLIICKTSVLLLKICKSSKFYLKQFVKVERLHLQICKNCKLYFYKPSSLNFFKQKITSLLKF